MMLLENAPQKEAEETPETTAEAVAADEGSRGRGGSWPALGGAAAAEREQPWPAPQPAALSFGTKG